MQGTVVVERWWKVPLSKEGRPPRLHPRRHRIYRLVEDTKNQPKGELEVILTQSVDNLGSRGDIVSVKKSLARNKLLLEGLAVYASPENKKMFEEEMRLREEGKLERLQTQSGEKAIQFLRSCRLEVGMKNNVKWELNNEIVARHFLKNLNVFVKPHAVKLPDEPITRWGEYWCEVTVSARFFGKGADHLATNSSNFLVPTLPVTLHCVRASERGIRTQILISALATGSLVSLGKSLPCSVPQFPPSVTQGKYLSASLGGGRGGFVAH
uniref:Large ribosomal subunit protein bL9m n=2 Tax=Gopherus TaxID=38771 RepID=A0A8C4YHX2_9SAUR